MKTVYMVRHGESEGNIGLIYQDQKSGLTEKGFEQARIVADRCAKLRVDALIASTMQRTQQTAAIISGRVGLPVENSDLLRERKRPSEIADKERGSAAAEAVEDAWNASLFEGGPRVSDGETFEDIRVRAFSALSFLETHPGSDLLVVGHGFFTRMMLAVILIGPELTGVEFKRIFRTMRTENTGITVLTMDAKAEHTKWRLRVFNDSSHLG